jgi:hypothetical protein
MNESQTRLIDVPIPLRDLPSGPRPGSRDECQGVPSSDLATEGTETGSRRGSTHSWIDFMREWYWEVFTWFLGSAALVAIIVLLVVFGNQPLDHWRLPMIQITTVVTALAQTAMATLIVSVSSCIGQLKWVWFGESRTLNDIQVFDDSSRGPAGSSLLLWNFLWKKREP